MMIPNLSPEFQVLSTFRLFFQEFFIISKQVKTVNLNLIDFINLKSILDKKYFSEISNFNNSF